MTGIERLRKLSEDMLNLSLWVRLATGTEKDWDCYQGDGRTVNGELLSIANQIEQEARAPFSRVRVLAVISDMERHASGVEGAEDSPVARWARELRKALGGDGRDPAADVSVSAYDLLPQEDRDAIAWVREHGGLSHVKDIYHDFRAVVERLGIEWSESELHGLMDALDRRLMPEGMEWPTVDGKPVDFVTGYEPSLGVLEAVSIYSNGACEVMSHDGIIKPVSEIHVVVLASDGEPLREGEHVYHVETGAELVVKELPKPGEYQAVVVFALPTSPASHLTSFDPDRLTHQRPDTWQRIEEDSTLSPEVYCHRNGIDISQKDGTEIFLADTVEPMARDLVRRCRALAERERGE